MFKIKASSEPGSQMDALRSNAISEKLSTELCFTLEKKNGKPRFSNNDAASVDTSIMVKVFRA
jgi:hypothetical protein